MLDIRKYIPQPENYTKGIPNLLFLLYKNMWINRDKLVLPIVYFKDKELAIEVIKGFMNRGGRYFCYFNNDYTKLILYKNEHSEKFINEKIKEKQSKKEQIQQQENGV